MLKERNQIKLEKLLSKTKYAWKGTSINEFITKHQHYLKYCNINKLKREAHNRSKAYANGMPPMQGMSHYFKFNYSDALTEELGKKSVLLKLLNKSKD